MSTQHKEAEFLSGENLIQRLKFVAAGQKVRCAIAFWSKEGVAQLFPSGVPEDAMVVCDIAMGSTSAEALRSLGAPRGKRLRHSRLMHAKVLLSDRGVVVSSANGSETALGSSKRPARTIEAGVFHATGTAAWTRALEWIEKLFRDASKVGPREIEWAEVVYRPARPPMLQQPPKAGSLLDLVCASPGRFDAVGFVFVATVSSKGRAAAVRDAAAAADPGIRDRVGKLPSSGIFSDWGKRAATRWPARFLEFWQPADRLWVSARRLEIRVPSEGAIMSVADRAGLEEQVGLKLPIAAEYSKRDRQLAKLVRGEEGAIFFSGRELAQRLAEFERKGVLTPVAGAR